MMQVKKKNLFFLFYMLAFWNTKMRNYVSSIFVWQGGSFESLWGKDNMEMQEAQIERSTCASINGSWKYSNNCSSNCGKLDQINQVTQVSSISGRHKPWMKHELTWLSNIEDEKHKAADMHIKLGHMTGVKAWITMIRSYGPTIKRSINLYVTNLISEQKQEHARWYHSNGTTEAMIMVRME